jgi:hypothetical protein
MRDAASTASFLSAGDDAESIASVVLALQRKV